MQSTYYFSPVVERAMKVQKMNLHTIEGGLKWYQAAEILEISDRQMRRWKHRYEKRGYDGLFDRRRQRPSHKRVPPERVGQVLTLCRERYFDLNVLHFHEEQVRLVEKANPYFRGRRVEIPYPDYILCQNIFLNMLAQGIGRKRRGWIIGMR